MLVFTTNHGEHMGQHSMYQKMEMSEPAVRVPAVFHLRKGKAKEQARRMKTAISHMDFVPTLADLFDLSTRNDLDGITLRESLEKGTEPEARDIFGGYFGNHQFGDMRRMVVSGSYKYIYDNKEEELYDLEADPWEQKNLCLNEGYKEIASEMHQKLEKRAKEQKDPFFQPKKKKNLLFIFANQWRRDAMGFANADPVKTPNMDSFARESVYCTDAVSTFRYVRLTEPAC